MTAPPRSLRLTWISSLVACLLAPTAHAGDACLQAELAAKPEFSGVALLRQQGQLRVAAQGAELGTETRFNLGSVSKMFTAVAVAQQVEKGKLELDAPIGRWVEGLTPEVAAVTLRQLLTHSGGLGNFFNPDNVAAMQQARSLADLRALARDTAPQFPPGSRFQYSNNGFLLLGLAVEKVSGQPFDAYLQQQVFAPASMASTSLSPAQPRAATAGFTRLPKPGTGVAHMQRPSPDSPQRPAEEAALPGSPAGGAYGTAADLMRFFDALRAGKLVGADTLAELTRSQIEPGPGLHYGLGFGVFDWEGHAGWGHNGGAPGVNAEALVFPADELVLVVLANRDPPTATQQMQALRQAALTGPLCR